MKRRRGGERKGENKYKTITVLTTICSKIRRDLYIKQIGFDVSAGVVCHGESALPAQHSFLGFEIEKYIYMVGGGTRTELQPECPVHSE